MNKTRGIHPLSIYVSRAFSAFPFDRMSENKFPMMFPTYMSGKQAASNEKNFPNPKGCFLGDSAAVPRSTAIPTGKAIRYKGKKLVIHSLIEEFWKSMVFCMIQIHINSEAKAVKIITKIAVPTLLYAFLAFFTTLYSSMPRYLPFHFNMLF